MGSIMQRFKGTPQGTPQQGAGYAPSQGQAYAPQQPLQPQQLQPQQLQQQPVQYRPPMGQMPQQVPQGYQPPVPQMQQQAPYGYGAQYPNNSSMSRYPGAPSMSSPYNPNQASYGGDMHLSSLTGLNSEDIGRLRQEYLSYANSYGEIDRDGFRKLYVAALLNMTWQEVERDAEAAFRTFDVNQTGGLDFNEYITACTRMARGTNQPSTYPSYNY